MTADQAAKPAPCLVCGRALDPVEPGSTQPVGALMLHGSGNYGSDFDPLDGTELQVNLCDPCLIKHPDRVLSVRTTTTVNWDVRPWTPDKPEPAAPARLAEQDGGIPNDAITRADWESATRRGENG